MKISTYFFWVIHIFFVVSCSRQAWEVPAKIGQGKTTVIDNGDNKNDVGWWIHIDHDSKGFLHIAYCDASNGDLKYAHLTPNGWIIETPAIEGASGKYALLAVDSKDRPHIAYNRQDTDIYYYLFKNSDGKWIQKELDKGKDAGMAGAITIDRDDNPHFIYFTSDYKLKYARVQTNKAMIIHSQTSTKAPSVHEMYPSIIEVLNDKISPSYSILNDIAISPKNEITVSYMDWDMVNAKLTLLKQDVQTKKWSKEIIDDQKAPGWSSQMVYLDGKDDPIVLYSTLGEQNLMKAEKVNGIWQKQLLLTAANGVRASQDSNNRLVIAFQYSHFEKHYGRESLRYMKQNADGSFEVFSADSQRPTAQYFDMTVVGDKTSIAYYDNKLKQVKVYSE